MRKRINAVLFYYRLSFLALAGGCQGGSCSLIALQSLCFWQTPLTIPHELRGKPLRTPKKPPPYTTTGMDGGMFFLPLRWTERIGDCRANAMVVPTISTAFTLLIGMIIILNQACLALAPIPVHDGKGQLTQQTSAKKSIKKQAKLSTKAMDFPHGKTFYNGLPASPEIRPHGTTDAITAMQGGSGTVRLTREQTGWFYQAQQPLRYQQLKKEWLQTNIGAVPTLYTLEQLAYKAAFLDVKGMPVWMPLTTWRMVGTPNPWVVSPRVSVGNNTEKAVVNLRVQTEVKVKLGVWYPKVPTALLDVERLQKTAAWLTVQREMLYLKPLVGKGLQLETLPAVSILSLLKAHPDKFPLVLQFSVWLFEGKHTDPSDTLVLELPCHPDIFAVPIYLY